jgi:NitT/TauT family transport system substrate-binding protein
MKRYRIPFLLLIFCLTLAACGGGASEEATQQPIIILASPVPTAGTNATQPTTSANQNQTAQPQTQPADDTPRDPAPATDPAASGASKGTITFAFDAFPSYYPGIIMETQGLLAKRGYELKLVPLDLSAEYEIPRDEQYEKMRRGEWDVVALTLDELAHRSDPSIGAITALIDESAGADKLVARTEIATLNDLRGKRIAFAQGTVGEYFVKYTLSLAGLSPSNVTLEPFETVEQAVQAFVDGQADAVSAWEPDILTAEEQGARVLIASDRLRAIVDVLVTSRTSIDTKSEAVQAFHDAWFEALKLMTDAPEQAEQDIIQWGNPDWTYIANPNDMRASLEKIAQATLSANAIAFQSPDTVISRLSEAQDVFINAGQTIPQTDLRQLVDNRFVIQSATNQDLLSSQPPVNASFLLTSKVNLPQLSPEEQEAVEAVVQLPLTQIGFEPDSPRLTAQAAEDLKTQVLPVLQSSTLYLKVEGSSAWPGPVGRFTEDDVRTFARERAESVATYLGQQGISPARMLINTIDPTVPNCLDDQACAKDRFVRFTLVAAPGR